jgi:hypothetical protein
MYNLSDYVSQPNILAFDENGDELDAAEIVSDINWNNATKRLTFGTDHFTLFAAQKVIEAEDSMDVTDEYAQIDYSDNSLNSTIVVDESVKEVSVDLSGNLSTGADDANVTIVGSLVANISTEDGVIELSMPENLTITGSDAWDGTFILPQLLEVTAADPTDGDADLVIEVGSASENLTFSRAVRIVLPGMAGKKAGFQRGEDFTEIHSICAADDQSAADALPDGSECYITVSPDLVIWTKHFTMFVAYTPQSHHGGGHSGGSTCVSVWNCTSWGACGSDGYQYRTCTDANLCSGAMMPAIKSVCTATAPVVATVPTVEQSPAEASSEQTAEGPAEVTEPQKQPEEERPLAAAKTTKTQAAKQTKNSSGLQPIVLLVVAVIALTGIFVAVFYKGRK